MPIAVAQSLVPTAAQAPIDARTVVAALADIADVENPYIGMEIYVTATGKKYQVKTLTETTVGTRTVYAVGNYEALPDAADLSVKADQSDFTELNGRVTDAETAIGTKAAQSDLTALTGRVTEAETAIAGKAAASDVTALAGRMTNAETAITGKASASDLSALANTVASMSGATAMSGVENEVGGYAVEVVGYEEGNDTYALLLQTDDEELDLTKFSAGETVTLSLTTGITETDEQTQESTTTYTLTSAMIDSVDSTNKKLFLTASLYQGDIISSTQIGWEKRAVSGYTASATGGPTSYRVTSSGAGNDDALRVGRKIYTRSGSGALVSNSIAGTSGNYIYLSSAAAGTTSIYLGPSNVFVSNGTAEEDDNTLTATGEYNFVAGEASGATGGYNTVVGVGSFASGVDNIVHGEMSEAHGEGNSVSGNASFAAGTNNLIADSMSTAVGQGNKLYYQSQTAVGTGNTLTGVSASAFGAMNTVSGYGSLAVGDNNKISGKNAIAAGYSNKVAAKSAYVIGRYADVADEIANKNALIVHGGTHESNGTALAVRSLKAIENPAYVPGSTTEEEYIEDPAFSTEYRGRLKAVPLTISDVGTITLDHDMYARWELTGTGAVTLALDNWQDGDRGEVVIDTSKQTFSIPAAWVLPDDVWDAWSDSPGVYCMEIRKEGGTVYAHAIVPFSATMGCSGSGWERSIVSSNTTAQAGYWYLCTDNITVTLPSSPTSGDVVRVSTVLTASSVSIVPSGSDTIEGATALNIDLANNSVELCWNGTQWIVSEVVASGSSQNASVAAPLDSPALIGTPTAPTAASGTNTTQIATTAFVQTAASSAAASAVSAFDSGKDYVVASGSSGSGGTYQWYRKYKSGWLEQGGYGGEITSDWLTITFPQPFASSNYIAIAQTTTIDYPSLDDVVNMNTSRTTTYCQFRNGVASGGHGSAICWYACGQGVVSNS